MMKADRMMKWMRATAGMFIVGLLMWGPSASAQAPLVRELYLGADKAPPSYNMQDMSARAHSAEAFTFETDNFIMSGRIDKAEGQALLADLESFRAAVMLAIGENYTTEIRKIEVFYAADNKDFEFITSSPGAGGIYRRTFEAPVFIINGASGLIDDAGKRQVAYHELTHHLLGSYYDGVLPIWLGEGLAEYFSAFDRAEDGTVTFGKVMPENVTMLTDFDWMTPRTLLESIQDYPFDSMRRAGNGFSYVDFFYAQSWLTAHYFQSDPARLENLSKFNTRLDPALDSEVIYTDIFGGDFETFEKDLKRYLEAGQFDTQSLISPKGPSDFSMTITPLSGTDLLFQQAEVTRKMINPGGNHAPLETLYAFLIEARGETSELALALARTHVNQDAFSKAEVPLGRALALAPGDTSIKTAAGIIALQKMMNDEQNNTDDIRKARRNLRDAIGEDDNNIEAHYYYALSYVMTGETAPASALTSAYKSEAYIRGPGFDTPRLFLAPILMQHKKYAQARPLIENVLKWGENYEIKRTARRMQRMLEREESGY